MASNSLIDNNKERFRMIALSPLYAVLQYLKLLGTFEKVHNYFVVKFKVQENIKLMTIENCFKV